MGLQSALSTALTGMTAAETTIDVVGNNVANANTVGFKESTVNFATQFLQTQSIGSAPTASRGGTNPRQVGLGAKVSEITPDFTQGTIEISSNPLDLAIQGDGFFIVQGSQGETLYTRNGQFKTNSDNEIVTITGQRVLGYSVDADFEIQPTGLSPLHIPLGAAAVAQATQNVVLKGALNPNDDVDLIQAGIIQSAILSDGSSAFPTTVPTGTPVIRPPDTTTVGTTPGVGIDPGNYSYKFTFVDLDGNEGPASPVRTVPPIGGTVASIDLTTIPQPVDPVAFPSIRIYRNDALLNNEYRLVTTLDATVFDDDHNDTATSASIAANALLDDTGLANGSYSYYVTYYNSLTFAESRPTSEFGPFTASATGSPRIRINGLPTPPDLLVYDSVRIYRSSVLDSTTFRLVDTVSPGGSYIDNTPDADFATAQEVNLHGPPIDFGTLLTDVVRFNESTYSDLFQLGELSFTGNKNDRPLGERNLTITATTTVGELLAFMEQAMGVVKDADEDTFPDSGISYGGAVTGSRLQFTSNMGVQNELGIDLSAFTLTPTATGVAQSIDLPFTNSQVAIGEGATAEFLVYDSLGTPLSVRVTTVLEDRDSSGARFRWIATSANNDSLTDVSTLVGTGVITTNGDGNFVSATQDRVAIDRGDSPANSPLEFQFDFSQVSGLSPRDANTESTLSAGSQDGFPAGTLTSFIISDSGRIQGVFSNGSARDLGQIRMARFANNGGLQQIGENMFTTGVNSGLPVEGDPGSQGTGSLTTGAVELSNTDIGQNLIELILASTQYRGGARVITAVQQLLDELLALRR